MFASAIIASRGVSYSTRNAHLNVDCSYANISALEESDLIFFVNFLKCYLYTPYWGNANMCI